MYYRYPAAQDSAQRLEDVLLLVGEVEGLGGEGAAPAGDAGADEAAAAAPTAAAEGMP